MMLLPFVPFVEAKTITVGPGGQYAHIQEAINAAAAGDIITVYSGKYHENLIINKPVTLRGIDTGGGLPVVDGGIGSSSVMNSSIYPPYLRTIRHMNIKEINEQTRQVELRWVLFTYNTVNVDANGVTFEGFVVENGSVGISIETDDNVVRDCNIRYNSEDGIELINADRTLITGCDISHNALDSVEGDTKNAITAYRSNDNRIIGNNICDNGGTIIRDGNKAYRLGDAVCLIETRGCIVQNNYMRDDHYAVWLLRSSGTTISGNDAARMYYDITIEDSSDNLIADNILGTAGRDIRMHRNSARNVIRNNTMSGGIYGVTFTDSWYNTLENNSITGSTYSPLWLANSSHNTIKGNKVYSNGGGLSIEGSSNNRVYFNDFDSLQTVTASNYWDSGVPLSYQYSGKFFTNRMGNHWKGYSGADSNLDGVGDVPFSSGGVTDSYPLVAAISSYKFGLTPSPSPSPTPTPVPGSALVSHTIPGSMIKNRQYTVSVTMKNTGTLPWSEAGKIRLGAVGDNSGVAAKFGPIRVYLPPGKVVNPGEQYTFVFNMTAPKAGTYKVSYRMVQDGVAWFGQTVQKSVRVTIRDGMPDAVIVSDTIPGQMVTGQRYDVSVTMKNNGTEPWAEEDMVRLGAVGDYDGEAALFGPVRVPIENNTIVEPGQEYTWSFTMTAPAQGLYHPSYRMVWNGELWFGETLTKAIRVQSPDGAADSELLSVNMPGDMSSGNTYSVGLTFKNTGDIPWTEGDMIRLGAVDDYSGDAVKFGPVRLLIPAGVSVSPGGTYTWTFTMTAPAAGTYDVMYMMVRDGKAWFGDVAEKRVMVT